MTKNKPLIFPVAKGSDVDIERLSIIIDAVFDEAYKQGYSDGIRDSVYKQMKEEEYESNTIKKIN